MSAKSLVLGVLVAFAFTAGAERPPPIEPAYAAEQPEMNSEVIAYEYVQFRALAQWHSSLDQMEIARTRRDFLRKQFDRIKQLKEKGNATTEKFFAAQYLAFAAANDFLRLEVEADMAKATMQVAKMRIIDYGNPSIDLRRQIIAARSEEMENQIKAQRLSLLNVEAEQKLAEGRAKNGERLRDKSYLSEADSDLRVMNAEVLAKQATSLRNQIATNLKALRGLELSLERVDKDGNNVPAKVYRK